MNTKLIAASLLALASVGTAFAGAGDFNLQNRTPFQGSLSRAQVQADTVAAIKDGTMPQIGEGYSYVAPKTSAPQRTRAEVRAEARQAARTTVPQEMM